MENKKIIFMGTPSIALSHLKTLLNHNYKIESVFTQPPRKKIEVCKFNNLLFINFL